MNNIIGQMPTPGKTAETQHIGEFDSLALLQIAHPTAHVGAIATIKVVNDNDVKAYWDDNDQKWFITTNAIRFLDENDVFKFESEAIKIEGVDFDTPNETIKIKPLQFNTVFVSSTGNDNTGVKYDANLPFKTLDAALLFSKQNNIDYIVIDDAGTYSFSQSFGSNTKISSHYKCTLNLVNNSGATFYLSEINDNNFFSEINIPNGILNLTPTNPVLASINSTRGRRWRIVADTINNNHNFAFKYTKGFELFAVNYNTTKVGNQYFIGANLKKTINKVFISNMNANGRNQFVLNSGYNFDCEITNLNYNEITYLMGGILPKYKIGNVNNTGINGNIYISGTLKFTQVITQITNPFQLIVSANGFVLKNSVINMPMASFFQGNSSPNNFIIQNCYIICDVLMTYRHRDTISVINSTIKCTKLSEGNTGSANIGTPNTKPLFDFIGSNHVFVPTDGNAIVSEVDPTLSSFIKITGTLKSNGIIDATVTKQSDYSSISNL